MNLHPAFTYNGIRNSREEWISFIASTVGEASEWEQPLLSFMQSWLNDEDFVEVQTSGSTGQPKTWKASKRAMIASATLTANYFNRKEGTTAFLCLPGSFIAGKMMLVRSMVFGWNLTVVRPSSTPLSALKHPFDFAAFTPMQLTSLNESELQLLSRFGSVIIGGAAVSESLCVRLSRYCDNVYETYGMAETLSHIALRKLTVPETHFQALEGVRLITDSEGRLQIFAPHLHSEIITTNDIVELIDERSFWYKGRYDRMINSGGIKLFAEAIERKLESVLTFPYSIGSAPDDTFGEKVVLYIEADSSMDLKIIDERLKQQLDRYEVPKVIKVVEKLERTESGKIKVIK
jgi:O-succinylbenzoic acid--CoA ligase